jgi:hypothetical protein
MLHSLASCLKQVLQRICCYQNPRAMLSHLTASAVQKCVVFGYLSN